MSNPVQSRPQAQVKAFRINPTAPSSTPQNGGVRYGHSFMAEREISLAAALHQAKAAVRGTVCASR